MGAKSDTLYPPGPGWKDKDEDYKNKIKRFQYPLWVLTGCLDLQLAGFKIYIIHSYFMATRGKVTDDVA